MAIPTLIISPPWFRGFDCVFEYFGVLVFLLIALFAYKATKMTNDQKTKWLFVSFLLIAASYFIKAFRNINLYFPFERQLLIGSLEVKYTSLAIINLVPIIDFTSRVLFLLGLVGVYFLITQSEEKKHMALMVYFITIVTYVSSIVPYVFHLTSAILLAEISYFYLKKTERKRLNQKLVLTAFLSLMMSQMLFLTFHPGLYVSAGILELFGFVLLLFSYVLVHFSVRELKIKKEK